MSLLMRLSAAAILAAACVTGGQADIVQLTSSKDNTLYDNPQGLYSNGKGQYFFAGTNANASIRRGVIAFDVVAAIPPGSTIERVELTLHMSRTTTGATNVALHQLTANWGEGESDADTDEGGGTNSELGDATWVHTFYPDQKWEKNGGDYDAAASATTSVNNVGYYTWGSTDALVADVQQWLDQPETQFGWIVIGKEDANRTAKRFDTRENPEESNWPLLLVEFTPPPPTCDHRADGNCDGVIDFNDVDCFVAALVEESEWVACAVEGCDYLCANDIDQNGKVEFSDIDPFVECLVSGCP